MNQFKFSKYCEIIVTENRNLGLSFNDKNAINYAILDDAFQNKSFESNYKILLSSSRKPFYSDHIFPLGRLRESKSNATRADILIFTKCSENLTKKESDDFVYKSRKFIGKNVPILFSSIDYRKPIKIFGNKAIIGAMSFVNKDVHAGTKNWGTPARQIN